MRGGRRLPRKTLPPLGPHPGTVSGCELRGFPSYLIWFEGGRAGQLVSVSSVAADDSGST